MRGDRPHKVQYRAKQKRFTPHARGSTAIEAVEARGYTVYPACAGIDRRKRPSSSSRSSLPRMRGDRPPVRDMIHVFRMFTPHARGSTRTGRHLPGAAIVYPACAGIDRTSARCVCSMGGLPRMRGDRPRNEKRTRRRTLFTPHARGSTCKPCYNGIKQQVYPACAGIDRIPHRRRRLNTGLPRMRGDRPGSRTLRKKTSTFTPHARGSTPARQTGSLL